MPAVLRWGVTALVLTVPGLAVAGTRIAVGPIKGDPESAVSGQLGEALCRIYECVLASRILTSGKPDFEKAKELDVVGILTGTVKQKKSSRSLALALLTGSRIPARTWSFPLTKRGFLRKDSVKQLAQDLQAELTAEKPPPATAVALPAPAWATPAIAASPKTTAEPLPPVTAQAVPISAAPPLAKAETAAAPATPKPAVAEATRPSAKATRTHHLGSVGIGVDLTYRRLRYQGVPPANTQLVSLTVDAIHAARVYLEVFPVALLSDDLFADIGVYADYLSSIGLQTQVTIVGTSEQRSTTYTRLETGVEWRARPLASSRFTLIPLIAYQHLKYVLIPSLSGLGMPDASLAGVKFGIRMEIPVDRRFAILAGGGYVRWLSAQDLIKGSPPFFPGASAYAVEAEVGVSVVIYGPLSVRILGEFSGTRYSLEPDPTGTYQATGATDQYVTGRALLGCRF